MGGGARMREVCIFSPKKGGVYQSIQKDRSCAFPLTVSSACSPIHQSIHLTHAPPQQSHIYIHLHTSTYIYILILTYHSYLNRRATRYGTGTSVQMAVYMAVHTWLSEGPGNVHHSVDSKIRQIVHRYVSYLSYEVGRGLHVRVMAIYPLRSGGGYFKNIWYNLVCVILRSHVRP